MDTDAIELEETAVDIQELLKHFNAKDFAKSLLPRTIQEELDQFDEDETTYYGKFLDNLEANCQLHDQLPHILKNSEIENLRVWSEVVFKEQKISGDIPPEKQIPCHNLQNEEITSTAITGVEIPPCMKRKEVNTEKVIKNFLLDEKGYKDSGSEENLHYSQPIEYVNDCFRFFYLNAFENLFGDYKTVHLFGKTYCPQTHKYKSCCVAVGPLTRKLYILPRSKLITKNLKVELLYNEKQILEEFYCVALKPLNVMKFKFRFVEKKNLDNMFCPEEVLFLEIEYSSHYPPVDQDVEGTSFCKVYGAKTNLFENFLLEKKIKGPCWIDISGHKQGVNRRTWCSMEILCTPEEIHLANKNLNLQLPPLTLLSLYIRSVDNINEKTREIALISWAICKNYDMSGGSHLNSEKNYCVFVNTEKEKMLPKIFDTFKKTSVLGMKCEKDMLHYFIEEFNKIDPDILIGYDFENLEVHNFVDRLVSLKINDFSRLSRFRGSPTHTNVRAFLFSGRPICDMKVLAKDLIFSKYHELETLYEKILNISNEQRCSNVSIVLSPEIRLLETIVHTTNESVYLLKLAMKSYVIPLVLKLSNICGTSLSQTLSGGVSKRSEFLLLYGFHEKGFVLQEKNFNLKNIDDDCFELSGGLVLEPKEGFYENFILLMDFQSLYPSIIQEYNLCLSQTFAKRYNSPVGVIPLLMKLLTEKRQKVKEMMNTFDKESDSYTCYNVYQSALKLTSNGIYGCLASRFFRFYCPSIAEEIVKRAQEILRNSVQILQNQGFEIIYGDTDSMMINTKSKDMAAVLNMGKQINEIINKKFSFIKLRVDSIFQRLLIVGKKKYAGIAVEFKKQTTDELKCETILKGLDVIRADWPLYVCQIGKLAIDYVLSDISFQNKVSKIKELLDQTKSALLNHQVPMQLLVITKYLTQDPENYTSKSNFPHVEVALRCNEETVYHFKKGDSVSYVMCCNKDSIPPRKAFHLGELKTYSDWKVDVCYYLHEKIYPMIWRICSCIDGMGPEIEEILGNKYITKNKQEIREIPKIKKVEFEGRDPFTFKCPECELLNVVEVDRNIDKNLKLLSCQNPECSFCPLKNPKYLRNRLVLTIRQYIKTYYNYRSSCTNRKCKYSSCRLPLNAMEIKDNCPSCKRDKLISKFNEGDLFLQLKYFRKIFDIELSLSSEQWITNIYDSLLKIIGHYENYSDFERVNLTQIFSNF